MLLNASRVGAIALLAAVMLRTAEALEADVEPTACRRYVA